MIKAALLTLAFVLASVILIGTAVSAARDSKCYVVPFTHFHSCP